MAAAYAQLIREAPDDFRIHTSLFTDPAIFEEEMRRIFEKTWVYVAHESEIPTAGDYRTTYIGKQPVIVSRDDEGNIHVLLNICRHRGNLVCRDERGSAGTFRCNYHGWVYKNSGELAGISHPQGYPESVGRDLSGLLPAARVATYRGLIFASLSDQVPSLEEHLGAVRPYVDLWADLSPVGEVRAHRPHSFAYEGNWKFQMENGADGYHPRFVHECAFQTMAHFLSRPVRDSSGMQDIGAIRGFPGGHSILERPGMVGIDPSLFREYTDLLAEQHGIERTQRIIAGYNILIFPNVYLMDSNIRVIQPIRLDETVVHSHYTELCGIPDYVNVARLKDVQWRLGTTGLIGTDDMEIFAAAQSAMQASAMPWLRLSRAMDSEVIEPSGERRADINAESSQRAMYREWLRLMSAS